MDLLKLVALDTDDIAVVSTHVHDSVAKVGDTPSDLEEGAAARCGLIVGVTNGSHTTDQLKRHPHTHLIAHLGQLPKVVLSQDLISAT